MWWSWSRYLTWRPSRRGRTNRSARRILKWCEVALGPSSAAAASCSTVRSPSSSSTSSLRRLGEARALSVSASSSASPRASERAGGRCSAGCGTVCMLRRLVSKFSYVVGIVLGGALLAPGVASAHALFGDHDPNRPLLDYLQLGFGHMVGGWDHLLFIGGVVLLAGSLRTAAKLISLFVAGHSLTLLVATLAGWQLNAAAVDVVIALSLVFVGIWGVRGLPRSSLFAAGVFGVGLVHGLGLST